MPSPIQPALNPANTPFVYKDSELTYPTVLIHEITFVGGTIWRVSTLPLNAAQSGITGFNYGGNDYFAYVSKEDLSALQQFSALGVTIMTSMKVHLFDGDGTSSFMELTYGFKGATIKSSLIMWQPGTLNFSQPVPVFSGVCEQAETGEDSNYLVVNCKSSWNLARQVAPSFLVSRICSNIFPNSAARHQAAADDPYAPEYGCGYSPTATGGNARGNAGFTTCPLTPEGCQARGMWDKDSSNRITRRFTGSQWNPPQSTRNVSYQQNKTITVFNTNNDAKYGTPIPIQAGTQWVDAKVLNVVGSGDSTRFEVALFSGDANDYTNITNNGGLVTVAGVQIPFNNQDALFSWYFTSSGNRTGAFTTIPGFTDSAHNPVSDPNGSMCVLAIVVPSSLIQAPAVPAVRVLSLGPINDIRQPNSTGTTLSDILSWPTGQTADPVWLLTYCMTQWWGYQWAQFNIASFISVSNKCLQVISHTAADGSTSNIQRFRASFVLTQQRQASDYLDAILNTFNGRLAPNPSTGLIDLLMESTLAEQQGSLGAVPYTNYTTAVSSFLMTGASASGYVAYYFDETSILDGPDGNTTTIKFIPPPASMAGNKISCKFQDTERGYVEDSLSKVDVGAYQRNNNVEQILNYPLFGLDNYDQANRVMSQRLAIVNYGNPTHQPCGTIFISIETTIKGLGLKPIDIILVQLRKYNIGPQLFRIYNILPTANYGTMTIEAYWHEDVDYIDSNWQSAQPIYSAPNTAAIVIRPPYPLKPNAEPNGFSQMNFAATQLYDTNNSGVPLALLQIYSQVPCNGVSNDVQPPLISPLSGISVGGGGNLHAGDWVVGVCAIDANGLYSAMSGIATVHVASGSSSLTIPVKWKKPTAVNAYMVFIGNSETGMFNVSTSPVTVSGSPPSTITITTVPAHINYTPPYPGFGPPDTKFYQLRVDTKTCIRAGTVSCRLISTALSSGHTILTVQQDNGPWPVNAYAGVTINLGGRPGTSGTGSDPCPIISALITANNAGTGPNGVATITVNGDYTASGTQPLFAGDVLYIDAVVESATANTITNSHFDTSGLVAHEAQGCSIVFLDAPLNNREYQILDNTSTVITTTTPFDSLPTAGMRFVIVSRAITSTLTTPGLNNNPNYSGVPLIAEIPIDNPTPSVTTLRDSFLYVVIYTLDSNGQYSFETQAPSRVLWIFGNDGTTISTVVNTTVRGPNGGGKYPVKSDALFPQAMFDLNVIATDNSDSSVSVTVDASPITPANEFSALIPAPKLNGTGITYATVGGSIPDGTTMFLVFAAKDSSGNFTDISNVVTIAVPTGGANTNTVTIPVTNYVSGMTQFLIYRATDLGVTGIYYIRSNSSGASITLTTLQSTTGDAFSAPDANFNNFAIGTTNVLLAGSFGGDSVAIQSGDLTAISKITAITTSAGNHYQLTLSNAAFTTSALIGRVLSVVLTAGNVPGPLTDYTITANDATSVTVVAPPASGLFPGPGFSINDQVTIRLKAVTFTSTSIADPLAVITTDQYQNKVIRIFCQDGSNQTAFVATNTDTAGGAVFTPATPFTVTSPVTYFWIEESTFSSFLPCPPSGAQSSSVPVDLIAPIANQPGYVAVQIFAQDVLGTTSSPAYSPIRDFYFGGAAGTAGAVTYAVSGTATVPHGVTQLSIDGATGPFTVTIESISTLDQPITCIRTDPPIQPPADWQATHAYSVGDEILDSNNHVQKVLTGGAGTSGSTIPSSWSTSGGTTSDGTVTWTDQGLFVPSPAVTIVSTGSTINGASSFVSDNYTYRSVTISKP